jgi:hypothetical protein
MVRPRLASRSWCPPQRTVLLKVVCDIRPLLGITSKFFVRAFHGQIRAVTSHQSFSRRIHSELTQSRYSKTLRTTNAREPRLQYGFLNSKPCQPTCGSFWSGVPRVSHGRASTPAASTICRKSPGVSIVRSPDICSHHPSEFSPLPELPNRQACSSHQGRPARSGGARRCVYIKGHAQWAQASQTTLASGKASRDEHA